MIIKKHLYCWPLSRSLLKKIYMYIYIYIYIYIMYNYASSQWNLIKYYKEHPL
jgi:hypothetical protein